MNQTEREYREAMDGLQFSNEEKERMMKNLMVAENQTKNRKHFPVRAVLLAAALAVGCVLSIAAGLPAQVYNFVSGGSLTIMPAGGDMIGGASVAMGPAVNDPIVLEDGKLWFVNGEERTDLTGLIDQNTPYIYEHTDPATGNKGYVILGGTVDDFGWAECVSMEGGSSLTGNNSFDYCVTLDGERLRMTDLTEEQMKRLNEMEGSTFETVCRPWLQTAIDQLGLDF